MKFAARKACLAGSWDAQERSLVHRSPEPSWQVLLTAYSRLRMFQIGLLNKGFHLGQCLSLKHKFVWYSS